MTKRKAKKKRVRKPKVRVADVNLASENYPELNAQFYGMEPHEHFRFRLRSLMIAANYNPELAELLSRGVTVGKLTLGPFQFSPEMATGSEVEAKVRDYLTVEAEMLLHQAAECALRLYLAHADDQPCPWLEVARLEHGYKAHIETHVASSDLNDDRLRRMLWGSTDGSGLNPAPSNEDIETQCERAALLLSDLARIHLDRAAVYNAIKHGNAAQAGAPMLSFGPIHHEGTAITYLTDKESETRRWEQAVAWLDSGDSLFLTWAACAFIERVLTIGAARRIRKPFSQLPGVPDVNLLYKSKEAGVGLTGFRMSLRYYEDPPGEASDDAATE